MYTAIPALIRLDPRQEVVQTVIWYNFMSRHRNPIQNALKLLKGTISVTQWITFFTLNNVTGLVFRLHVCKHSGAQSGAFFVL